MAERARAAPRPARLHDVARAAGVHFSTVSRALNGSDDRPMRPETRARILAAARALDYRPNALARGLKLSATGALGMLVPSLRNPAMADIIRGAFDRAFERGFVVLLVEDRDGDATHAAYDRLVAEGRIDGLLVASARPGSPLLDRLVENGVPCVFVGRRHAGSRRNVTIREEDAGRVAAEHLLALGHRRLAHISGPAGVDIVRRREDGFAAACAAAGLTARIVHAPLDERGGAEAAARLLAGGERPTALLVTNFNQTFGALGAIRAAGLRIPADISVVTCDDDPAMDYVDPPLSSVAMPLVAQGAAAVDALLEQLDGLPPRDVELAELPVLRERRSTGPPPGA